jgi:hypothetical protein
MSQDSLDHPRPRCLHQRRIRNTATLDGQPVNLSHLLRGQNLHRLIIIARREKSAKGLDAACARSDKLANIMRSLPHQFLSLPSSSSEAKKAGKTNGSNYESVPRAVASENSGAVF